jgi:peptidoglycan/LPS O-acetylase OafA/YrhL
MRSLAVLAVLLFHLDVIFFPGGFLGVDLFFVISGFIITRNVLFDIERQRFTLKDFYYRRFRRIIPALVATVFVTLLIALRDVPPTELALTAKSAIYSLFSLGNINFWLESGYFDSSAHTKPLLHTWSLSVEEQFYIFWPALLLMTPGFRGRALLALVLFLVSLGLSGYYERITPEGVFYLLPFRVHQFMAGGLIAILALRMVGIVGNILTLIGSIGLIWGFGNMTGETSPLVSAGWVSLCGFVLILSRESRVSMILYGNVVMQWLGARSYALYLVHWPIIVLLKYRSGFELSLQQGIALALGSIAAAVALHELVEKPFRKSGPDNSSFKRAAAPLTFASLLLAIFVSANFWGMGGIPQRIDGEIGDLVKNAVQGNIQRYQLIRFRKCHLQDSFRLSDFDEMECASVQQNKHNVLVIGDSLAADVYMMLSQTYPYMHIGQATAAGCPPLLSIKLKNSEGCYALNELRLKRLVKKDVDIVVLAARWNETHIPHLQETVKFLQSIGKEVLVFGPRIKFVEMVHLMISQQVSAQNINEKLSSKADRQEGLLENIRRALPGIQVIDFVGLQCTPICDVIDSGSVLYADKHHLTPAGSRLFGKRFSEVFDLEKNMERAGVNQLGASDW